MSGGKWAQAAIEKLAETTAKNKIKKDEARVRFDVRQNFGFSDSQTEKVCGMCHESTSDVYRFMVALPELVSRFSRDGGEMELCQGCLTKISDKGIRVKSLPELTAADLSPSRNIYDTSKSRKKIF